MDVGGGANVIKALKESAKRIVGGETRTAQRRNVSFMAVPSCLIKGDCSPGRIAPGLLCAIRAASSDMTLEFPKEVDGASAHGMVKL